MVISSNVNASECHTKDGPVFKSSVCSCVSVFPLLSVPTHHICLMLLTPSQCQLTATDHVGKSSPSANSLSVCMGLFYLYLD